MVSLLVNSPQDDWLRYPSVNCDDQVQNWLSAVDAAEYKWGACEWLLIRAPSWVITTYDFLQPRIQDFVSCRIHDAVLNQHHSERRNFSIHQWMSSLALRVLREQMSMDLCRMVLEYLRQDPPAQIHIQHSMPGSAARTFFKKKSQTR